MVSSPCRFLDYEFSFVLVYILKAKLIASINIKFLVIYINDCVFPIKKLRSKQDFFEAKFAAKKFTTQQLHTQDVQNNLKKRQKKGRPPKIDMVKFGGSI